MREFLRGWKRKVGAVAVVMACTFSAAWLRCSFFEDKIIVKSSPDMYALTSDPFGITVIRDRILKHPHMGFLDENRIMCSSTSLKRIRPSLMYFATSESSRHLTFLGIHYAEFEQITDDIHDYSTGFVVPHIFVVIPLTLLSAYLLLSKPRRPASTISGLHPHYKTPSAESPAQSSG